jgi:hypothetical protein
LIVVENSAVVLVHHHDIVAPGTKPVGRIVNTRTDAENGMEQCDIGHAFTLYSTTDIRTPAKRICSHFERRG